MIQNMFISIRIFYRLQQNDKYHIFGLVSFGFHLAFLPCEIVKVKNHN